MRLLFVLFINLLMMAPMPLLAQSQNKRTWEAIAGQWVDMTGEPIRIEQTSFGWDAWLAKYGQAAVLESNGEHGSHLKVSGRVSGTAGYECFYYVSLLSSRQMSWALRQGDPLICPSLGLFTKASLDSDIDKLEELKRQLDAEKKRSEAIRRAQEDELRVRRAELDAREAALRKLKAQTESTNNQAQSQAAVPVVRPHWCSTQKNFESYELIICSNAYLSQLDIQLEAIYGALMVSRMSTSADSIRVSQRAWVRDRHNCGSGIACLRQTYEARINTLRGY